MPKATQAGASHADLGVHEPVPADQMQWVVAMQQNPAPDEIGPPEAAQPDALDLQDAEDRQLQEEGDGSSAGTSSSTSDGAQDKNGSTTGTDPQSPAPDVASRSSADPAAKPVSSSAATTDGSTQGTGSDQAHQLGSSAEPQTQAATPVPDQRADWKGGPSEADPRPADS